MSRPIIRSDGKIYASISEVAKEFYKPGGDGVHKLKERIWMWCELEMLGEKYKWKWYHAKVPIEGSREREKFDREHNQGNCKYPLRQRTAPRVVDGVSRVRGRDTDLKSRLRFCGKSPRETDAGEES